MHRRSRWRSRNRRRREDGSWAVRARVERFGEPALLRLLSERPTHGYELLERLPELLGEERVDVGNLYRVLREKQDAEAAILDMHTIWEPDGPWRELIDAALARGAE